MSRLERRLFEYICESCFKSQLVERDETELDRLPEGWKKADDKDICEECKP